MRAESVLVLRFPNWSPVSVPSSSYVTVLFARQTNRCRSSPTGFQPCQSPCRTSRLTVRSNAPHSASSCSLNHSAALPAPTPWRNSARGWMRKAGRRSDGAAAIRPCGCVSTNRYLPDPCSATWNSVWPSHTGAARPVLCASRRAWSRALQSQPGTLARADRYRASMPDATSRSPPEAELQLCSSTSGTIAKSHKWNKSLPPWGTFPEPTSPQELVQVDPDTRYLVLVRVLSRDRPEELDLAVDRRPGHAHSLQPLEAPL